jgi:hypothetical protein
MIKKILSLFLLQFTLFHSFSQERKTIISGKVFDSLSVVKNANIINLKTNQGTFSGDNGMFIMLVSLGDSLQISSVQHQTKSIRITSYHLRKKIITISLNTNIYVLDAFELKRHHLSGSLGIDSRNVPINKRDSLLGDLINFSNINMKIIEGDDYIDKRVRPPTNNVDPTAKFAGAGGGVTIPFKNHESILGKKLAIKKAFPAKLLSQLGTQFFFVKLQIPKDNYFHFLEYANPLGIEKLHKEGEILKLISILQEQSILYLKIIKKE